MVGRSVRVAEVVGSNPVAPVQETLILQDFSKRKALLSECLFCFWCDFGVNYKILLVLGIYCSIISVGTLSRSLR